MMSRYIAAQLKHNSYFVCGAALGLLIALVAVPLDEPVRCNTETEAPRASFEPRLVTRPPFAAPQSASRAVARPRYYSTELGMRGSLLAAALTNVDALSTRALALNRTASALPSLRLFVTAQSPGSAPARANVVAFTDTREMLKPFHALKYLADNYLEEYNFFFLVSDTAYVNAHRLNELVTKLSVSQDVYMGIPADDDTHYCSLERGILLSNSVLRAVHNSLDWCVRNSYSPQHHENLGRCVLHASQLPCTSELQGQHYSSVHVSDGDVARALTPALAAAVTAAPLEEPQHFYQMHAYVSRLALERAQQEVSTLRVSLARNLRRHPPGFRNCSWPAGLRTTPGLPPPPPQDRFDHLRWTLFNSSHALLQDDHVAARRLSGANKQAIDLVLEAARAFLRHRGVAPTEELKLVEGAWRWDPPRALQYRLLVETSDGMRQLEASRVLGAARLVPVPYVTESARIVMLLPVLQDSLHVDDFLQRYKTVAIGQDRNTELILVLLTGGEDDNGEKGVLGMARATATALAREHSGVGLRLIDAVEPPPSDGDGPTERWERARRFALQAALPLLSRTQLLLLAAPDMEYNQDFLNRVRMNTVSGSSWFSPVPFARFAQYAHPKFIDAKGKRPQVNTGRFDARDVRVLSIYRSDLDDALSATGASLTSLSSVTLARALASSPLRCVRAPEPGLVLAPPPRPCARVVDGHACRARVAEQNLGARHALARLLLETWDERATA